MNKPRTMSKTRCSNRHTRRTLAVVLTAVLICSVAMSSMAAGLFGGSSKEDSYRSINVYQFKGTAEVERENVGKLGVYNNMQLQSKDKVTTGKDSELYLKLDSDKYMLAEANTQFDIVAEGTKKNSKTKIELKSGSVINRIDAKLAEEESYEVSTANSTMAVRGTKFKITVYVDADGVSHTQVSVYDGTVQTRLANSDGTYAEPVDVNAGLKVDISRNSDDTNAYYDLAPADTAVSIDNIAVQIDQNELAGTESDFINNDINYVDFKELFYEFVTNTVSDVDNTISDISNIITNNTPVMIKADPSAADDNSSSDSTEDKSSNQTEAQQSETSSQADETETETAAETEKESESAKESESEKESESVTETETETEAETEKESSDSDKDIPEDEGTESETKEGTDTDTETETDTETDTDTDTETESLGSDDDIPEDKEQIAPEETDS